MTIVQLNVNAVSNQANVNGFDLYRLLNIARTEKIEWMGITNVRVSYHLEIQITFNSNITKSPKVRVS